eukprot:6190426-Pleurochrysis_carterae.AAC.3
MPSFRPSLLVEHHLGREERFLKQNMALARPLPSHCRAPQSCAPPSASSFGGKDPLQSWYLRAGGSASEDYDALLRLLRCELRRLAPTKLVTIGASMGGYAALRAGIALAASHVLVFGAQVYIDPSHRSMLELPPMFFDEQLRALKMVADEAGVAMEPAYWQWARVCQRKARVLRGEQVHGECSADRDGYAGELACDGTYELSGLL